METILGLIMIFAQIAGTVIIFGGWKDCPKRLRICIGVGQCGMMLAIIGLTYQ